MKIKLKTSKENYDKAKATTYLEIYSNSKRLRVKMIIVERAIKCSNDNSGQTTDDITINKF